MSIFFTWPMTGCSWLTPSVSPFIFCNLCVFVLLISEFTSHRTNLFPFFPSSTFHLLIKIEYLDFCFTESNNIKQELSNLPSSLPLIYLFKLMSSHSIPVMSLLLFRPNLSSIDLSPSIILLPASSASPSPSALLFSLKLDLPHFYLWGKKNPRDFSSKYHLNKLYPHSLLQKTEIEKSNNFENQLW